MKMTRAYRQVARADAAQETVMAARRAAVALWRERDYDEITLAEVAERAGVTVQTLIRRFGSKQGLLDDCLSAGNNEVEELRARAPVGDVEAALAVLLEHYESDGDATLRTLRMESRSEAATRIVEHGRKHHRQWCERVFAPYLPPRGDATRKAKLDAFVAATDVYLWKLWRRDLRRSVRETTASWRLLVTALANGEKAGTTR